MALWLDTATVENLFFFIYLSSWAIQVTCERRRTTQPASFKFFSSRPPQTCKSIKTASYGITSMDCQIVPTSNKRILYQVTFLSLFPFEKGEKILYFLFRFASLIPIAKKLPTIKVATGNYFPRQFQSFGMGIIITVSLLDASHDPNVLKGPLAGVGNRIGQADYLPAKRT